MQAKHIIEPPIFRIDKMAISSTKMLPLDLKLDIAKRYGRKGYCEDEKEKEGIVQRVLESDDPRFAKSPYECVIELFPGDNYQGMIREVLSQLDEYTWFYIEPCVDIVTPDVNVAEAVRAHLVKYCFMDRRLDDPENPGEKRVFASDNVVYYEEISARRNIVFYADMPSKFTGQPCCHFEPRIHNSDFIKRHLPNGSDVCEEKLRAIIDNKIKWKLPRDTRKLGLLLLKAEAKGRGKNKDLDLREGNKGFNKKAKSGKYGHDGAVGHFRACLAAEKVRLGDNHFIECFQNIEDSLRKNPLILKSCKKQFQPLSLLTLLEMKFDVMQAKSV